MQGASNLLYLAGDALRSIKENPATTIFTAATLGFSLAIFAFFAIIFTNLNAAASKWGERTHIIVYLGDDVTEPTDTLKQELLRVPGVKSAEFVSREKALSELKDGLKGHEAVFEGISLDVLPASFEIKLQERFMEPAQTEAVAKRLKELAWVDDIQYSSDWIEKFAGLVRFIELAALVIGVFLAAATVFIVSNTIRLAVYARKDEIEIARLVGASSSYIRVPFFIEGVLEGVFGGVLAFLMLWGGRVVIAKEIPQYLSFIVEPAFPAASIFWALLLAGIIMGAAGSIISMGRFLKV